MKTMGEISNNNLGSHLRLSRMQELHSLTSVNLAGAFTRCCISKTKEEKSKVNSSSTAFLCIDLSVIFRLASTYSYVSLFEWAARTMCVIIVFSIASCVRVAYSEALYIFL